METCIGLFVVLIIAAVVVAVAMAINNANAQRRAKEAYYGSLDALKRDPGNPDLREQTLLLGRAYVQAVAVVGGGQNPNPAFTELMLMNDLQAACARAEVRAIVPEPKVVEAAPVAQAAPNGPTIEQRLRTLEELWSKGLISEEEHRGRRQRILDEV